MPKFIHKGAFAFVALTLAISGTAATAQSFLQDQNVLVLDEAFFPTTTYVQLGDKLTFINHSDDVRTVTGADDAWTSGELAKGGTFVYTVSETSPLLFTSVFAGEESLIYEGKLSFDEPPLSVDYIDDADSGEAISAD